VSRHEVLRTHLQFDTAAKRLYARVAVVQEVALETQTLPPEACAQYLREQAALPFDFAKGPLWRFRLVASGAHTWALLLCVHHCLNDGWSGGVLLRNLATAYNARLKNAQWQPPRIELEFRGFCLQEQEADMQALHSWREYLHAADRLHSWPHTGTRRWPFALALEEELIGADIALPLRSATCALQIETSVFVLTALRRALHVLSGLDELGIGTPVSVRNRSAQDESIGYFVNLLLTRDRIETDGLGALHTVRRSLAAALR